MPGRGRGVPGVWYWVGGLGGLYRYHPGPSQDPILVIFQATGPTHGQMKAILEVFMRFLRVGSRIDPN